MAVAACEAMHTNVERARADATSSNGRLFGSRARSNCRSDVVMDHRLFQQNNVEFKKDIMLASTLLIARHTEIPINFRSGKYNRNSYTMRNGTATKKHSMPMMNDHRVKTNSYLNCVFNSMYPDLLMGSYPPCRFFVKEMVDVIETFMERTKQRKMKRE